MANSKLTREQKDSRIEWLSALQFSDGEIAACGRYTVAKLPMFPGSRMAQFIVSYCAKDEQKIRRKVGEFYALDKMYVLGDTGVTLPSHITAMDLASMLAEFDEDDSGSEPEPWTSTMGRYFG
jgi:hypothetical protein